MVVARWLGRGVHLVVPRATTLEVGQTIRPRVDPSRLMCFNDPDAAQ
jgi:hypothetical protein